MANENNVRFTLSDNTIVIVKKMMSDKYDFELFLNNGIRKTFAWNYGDTSLYTQENGKIDKLLQETIETFMKINP